MNFDLIFHASYTRKRDNAFDKFLFLSRRRQGASQRYNALMCTGDDIARRLCQLFVVHE